MTIRIVDESEQTDDLKESEVQISLGKSSNGYKCAWLQVSKGRLTPRDCLFFDELDDGTYEAIFFADRLRKLGFALRIVE